MTRSLASCWLYKKGVRAVERDAIQALAAAFLLALLIKNCQNVDIFEEGLCDAVVATEPGKAGVLDELGPLHVARIVWHLGLEDLRYVIQLERHGKVHDQMNEVINLVSCLTVANKGLLWKLSIMILHALATPSQPPYWRNWLWLVTGWLQGHFSELMKRFKHVEAVKLVHDSNMAHIAQHHSFFFVTIRRVEGVEQLDKNLFSGDCNELTALIDAVMMEGSLQLRDMRWVNLTKRHHTCWIWSIVTQIWCACKQLR